MIKVKVCSKEAYDQKFRPLKGKIGEQVYAIKEVREGKFDSRREEPFTIVSFTEKNNVVLEEEFGERCMKHAGKFLIVHDWEIKGLMACWTK